MVISDEYSRWIEIVKMRITTTKAVINELRKVFTMYGFPDSIMCDNGTQFISSEFKQFVSSIDCILTTSSPRHPQSNGGAENAVKQAKQILNQSDPLTALMTYRATPTTTTGFSPCELLQGRKMKTTLPVNRESLIPSLPDIKTVRRNHKRSKENQKKHHDERNGAQSLRKLKPGDRVRIRTPDEKRWSEPATVIRQLTQRSYEVETRHGVYRRNRRHLQLIPSDVQTRMRTLRLSDAPTQVQPEVDVIPRDDTPQRRYPVRERRMPERYRDYVLN